MSKKKKNEVQHQIEFGNKTLELLTIEFPLYLKNKAKTLYWRYHQDGKYECIVFGKNTNCLQYGVNEYWKSKDEEFEKIFITRQIELNDRSNENEFIQALEDIMNRHGLFLNGQAFRKLSLVKEKIHVQPQNIGGIIVKGEGEEDAF